MAATSAGGWNPSEIRRFVKNFDSAAGTVLVETDKGPGYLKAMGNHSGEHVLACEWVGSQLARWFGLLTFDFCLIEVTPDDEIPFFRGGQARAGPAFISRAEHGQPWGGGKRELTKLVNPEDVTRLVTFDTWTRNCDRRSPDGKRVKRDNVFLSEESPTAGQVVLKAIDHTHCFTCGHDLTPRVADIALAKDPQVFGLFREFRPLLDREVARQAANKLRELRHAEATSMISTIPGPWDVGRESRKALADLIVQRASYVADTIEERLWRQRKLGFREAPEDKR